MKDAKDTETSEDALNAAVRKAGVAIKEKAQAVRTWKQNYDRETNSLVSQSAETTFEILDKHSGSWFTRNWYEMGMDRRHHAQRLEEIPSPKDQIR